MGPCPPANLVSHLILLGRGNLAFHGPRAALGRLSSAFLLEIGLVGFGPLERMDRQSGGEALRML